MPTIDTLLDETRHFPPAASGVLAPGDAARLRHSFQDNPTEFWADLARKYLLWGSPFSEVLDDSAAPVYRWFQDGTLNASVNCLDRHLPARATAVAVTWEAEDGEVVNWTYEELHDKVCRFAGTLQDLGVETGDRVIIYMPMVPEITVAMLACARIGAVHSVVFGGFSSKALADRIVDTGARVVLTADGALRGGKVVPLKANVDVAVASCKDVKHVVVLARTRQDVPMTAGRDKPWTYGKPVHVAADLPAEHPLFILYTSGSTGKPKGIVHSTGGYLLWAHASTHWVFSLQPGDTYWCSADAGWITGHTYVVYGPLMAGARVFLYEGAPMHPEPDRFWSMIARHKIEVLYTAPTAIRAFMAAGDTWPAKHDLSSLRLLGTVGEPINPEAWMWYHKNIGNNQLPIVDTWWQTETGGIMMSALPAVHTQRPGSCNQPLPGIQAFIVDESGQTVEKGGGQLALQAPWPSMLRGVWGDPERFKSTYWDAPPGTYMAGDTAHRDSEGDFWILGRSDDVLNVSGHRIGTMEVESALVSHPAVSEAAVVGVPDDITGEALFAFVVSSTASKDEVCNHVASEIGKTARPKHVVFASALPKTRSGKIMRRILRAIARGEELTQDMSTLEDADVVAALQEQVRRN